MENPVESKNHLITVGNILNDGQPLTDEQHLSILMNGIGKEPDVHALVQAMDYAGENISDPETRTLAQLHIAERAVGSEQYPYSYQPEHRAKMSPTELDKKKEENQPRLDMAIAVASDVLNSEQPLEDSTIAKAFSLVINMQASTAFEYMDDRKCLDSPRESYKKVLNLAHGFLDRAKQSENPTQIIGGDLHRAYATQISAVLRTETPNQRRKDQRDAKINELVEKALNSIEVGTPDAVRFCMQLAFNGQAVDKQSVLVKALEITKASSREPKIEIKKSRFGFKREYHHPSSFEDRREIIKEKVDSNFFELLMGDNVGFLRDFVALYPESAEEGEPSQSALWMYYSNKLKAAGFINGHYSKRHIQEVLPRLDKFAQVAPSEIVERTRESIKTRLAYATAL